MILSCQGPGGDTGRGAAHRLRPVGTSPTSRPGGPPSPSRPFDAHVERIRIDAATGCPGQGEVVCYINIESLGLTARGTPPRLIPPCRARPDAPPCRRIGTVTAGRTSTGRRIPLDRLVRLSHQTGHNNGHIRLLSVLPLSVGPPRRNRFAAFGLAGTTRLSSHARPQMARPPRLSAGTRRLYVFLDQQRGNGS
jgi:hypothetical protein